MGITTVAVHSDPDRREPFVTDADVAFSLGGSTPAESYLDGDAIIEAARSTGADAVHPGYGFLAENASFAQAVVDADLIWVGPPADAIETMGSKLASKEASTSAGVPTAPSRDLGQASTEEAIALAEDLGYPLLVKASAGGGGKGMRIVSGPEDLRDAVEPARREAQTAFGDPAIFLERYLDGARHVEIQILADQHGNIVSCGERECSIQRRHQKIIEEAPSPAIDAINRKKIGEAAIEVARTVDYVGAGTVEFLYQDGDFYFLEMNTRLQVEHPVTEEVQGIDLVEWQLRIADGESLPEDLVGEPVGASLEARIYAEDPKADYLPSVGDITRFEIDRNLVRVETGVESGSVVGIEYDPLIAKVISWAPDRGRAAAVLARALRGARVGEVITNIGLLVNILEDNEFIDGRFDTSFLDRRETEEFTRPLLDKDEEMRCLVAVALFEQTQRRRQATVQQTIPSGWRNSPSQSQITTFVVDGEKIEAGYRLDRNGVLTVDGFETAEILTVDEASITLQLGSISTTYWIDLGPEKVQVFTPRGSVVLHRVTRHPEIGENDVAGSLHAPMPGRVVDVNASPGEVVEQGAALVVMEAMKMEHTLRAPHQGKITEMRAAVGDQVDADAILVVIEGV